REERTQLGKIQGKFTEEHFIAPHRELLESWASNCTVPAA
ncbi:putative oxygenase MesX, partial [Glutamicibacter ardleyensis]